jgi:hypothetical protein
MNKILGVVPEREKGRAACLYTHTASAYALGEKIFMYTSHIKFRADILISVSARGGIDNKRRARRLRWAVFAYSAESEREKMLRVAKYAGQSSFPQVGSRASAECPNLFQS